MVVGLRLGLLALSGWFAWGNGRAALLGDAPSKAYPPESPSGLGDSQEAGPAHQKSSIQSATGSSWSWWKSSAPPSPPSGGVDGELDWGWWSMSVLAGHRPCVFHPR